MSAQDKSYHNDVLLLAGKVLTIIVQAIFGIAAIAMTLAIPAIVFFQDKINAEITVNGLDAGPMPVLTLVGIFATIIAMLALIFVFMGKLRAIISSVGEGDPFAPENADRLTLMAWLLVGVQVLILPLGALVLALNDWIQALGDGDVTMDIGLDIEGILMIIVLFILARVFKHGAAMRDDLEGTV